MFLTKSEIKELTGYHHNKLQCQELTRLGLQFLVNSRFGNPLVLRKELELHACSKSHSVDSSINLEALARLSNG